MMAQAIHCDGEGHADALADVMVSNLSTGDTSAWCGAHYIEASRELVAAYDAALVEVQAQAEADQTDRDAQARLEGVTAPPGEAPETTGDQAAPPDLAVGTFRAEGDQPLPEGVGSPETGAAGEAGPEPTDVENGAPGPPTGGTEDAGEPVAEPAGADAPA